MEPVMRYSREHKLETHARIVKKASVRLARRARMVLAWPT